MSSYDLTRPNFTPKNAVWNRVKQYLERDLIVQENQYRLAALKDIETAREKALIFEIIVCA
jgi:hypothetical protein